jgi:hypothetical protein
MTNEARSIEFLEFPAEAGEQPMGGAAEQVRQALVEREARAKALLRQIVDPILTAGALFGDHNGPTPVRPVGQASVLTSVQSATPLSVRVEAVVTLAPSHGNGPTFSVRVSA